MEDKICKLIGGLLPTYVKQGVDAECEHEIKEHLKTCEICQAKYDKEVEAAKTQEEHLKGFARRLSKRKKIIVGSVTIGVIAIFFLFTIIFQIKRISGYSMAPTYNDGQNLLVSQIPYVFTNPKRGDIVLMTRETEGGRREEIKRIIGIPGDTIDFKDEKLYINGKEQTVDYITANLWKEEGMIAYPFTLADDSYFVLGDNQLNSFDSRYEEYGKVEKSQIEGKVLMKWIRLSLVATKQLESTAE